MPSAKVLPSKVPAAAKRGAFPANGVGGTWRQDVLAGSFSRGYDNLMLMVWDEAKRERNVEKHGLDFAEAESRFEWETADIVRSYHNTRGGERFTAIGFLDERLVALTFSMLGTEAVSAISLRPANRKEKARYDES